MQYGCHFLFLSFMYFSQVFVLEVGGDCFKSLRLIFEIRDFAVGIIFYYIDVLSTEHPLYFHAFAIYAVLVFLFQMKFQISCFSSKSFSNDSPVFKVLYISASSFFRCEAYSYIVYFFFYFSEVLNFCS